MELELGVEVNPRCIGGQLQMGSEVDEKWDCSWN